MTSISQVLNTVLVLKMKLFWIVENESVQSKSIKVSTKGILTHIEIISYITRQCDKIFSLRIITKLKLRKRFKEIFTFFVCLFVYVHMSECGVCTHHMCISGHWVCSFITLHLVIWGRVSLLAYNSHFFFLTKVETNKPRILLFQTAAVLRLQTCMWHVRLVTQVLGLEL